MTIPCETCSEIGWLGNQNRPAFDFVTIPFLDLSHCQILPSGNPAFTWISGHYPDFLWIVHLPQNLRKGFYPKAFVLSARDVWKLYCLVFKSGRSPARKPAGFENQTIQFPDIPSAELSTYREAAMTGRLLRDCDHQQRAPSTEFTSLEVCTIRMIPRYDC